MADQSAVHTKWIKIAGFGGQGIIMAGAILGKAAAFEDKEVLQTQSYGGTARGGACESNVVISNEKIHELSLEGKEFDVMACLSQQALDRYGDGIKENGILIVDNMFVQDTTNVKKGVKELVSMPFASIAEQELGRRTVANIIVLGYLTKRIQLLRKTNLKKAVVDTVPAAFKELNLEALEKGLNL